MDKIQAVQGFLKQFGIPAYDSGTIPDDAELPYLTYANLPCDSFGATVPMTISLWYRSTNWADISRKAEEISYGITRGGRMLTFDDGAVWIRKGTPWAQRMSDPDDSIRRIVLNVELEFLD